MHPLIALAFAVGLLGMLSLVFVKIGLFVSVGCLIAGLFIPRERYRGLAIFAVVIGGLCSLAAFAEFVVHEGALGIVEAGQGAAVGEAVARLREIRAAEDAARTHAFWDPDHDAVGSALSLPELAGAVPVRGQVKLDVSPLHPRYAQHALPGPHGSVYVVDGYCFVVYVPDDDELAERRYIAYGWPADGTRGGAAIFLDEHERIYVSDNRVQNYSGNARVPAFDAALSTSAWTADPPASGTSIDGGTWTPWKKKKAMTTLPGDHN
jgi:hypothetical protein